MEQQSNFFDPKTIFAIVFVGVIWLGWQHYMTTKYPQAYKKTVAAEKVSETADAEPAAPGDHFEAKKSAKKSAAVFAPTVEEKTVPYESKNLNFFVSSQGMGLRSITLSKYTDRQGNPVAIGTNERAVLATKVDGQYIEFKNVKRESENIFSGTASGPGWAVEKKLTIDSDNYLIKESLKIKGNYKTVEEQASELALTDETKGAAGKQIMGAFDAKTWASAYVEYSGTKERIHLKPDYTKSESFEKTSLLAIGSSYFGLAITDESTIYPTTNFFKENNLYVGTLTYRRPEQMEEETTINLTVFAGPKSMSLMSQADIRLKPVVDYGFFGWLGEPLLWIMNSFYKLTGNYGWAIVLMTLLVRMFVLPLYLMQLRSMKAMQRLQPQINSIRERHKEDPQAMNQAMMGLWKENKVNPFGSCLPMFLQIPVFFALYQVLLHSVELYKAPFILWIQDLSLKDPYYVLPVLMGGTLFLQTKLTPSTMDPAQQKVMMIMPILFSAFMLTLPSGLTLYIFVSTLFGIIQQVFVMKEKNDTLVKSGAKS